MKKKVNKTKRKVGRFVYWTPRILSIFFILFLALFSLDIFDMKLGFWGTVLGLFMHNIPVFILAVILIISWKHELGGAIAFTLAGLLYIGMLLFNIFTGRGEWYMLAWAVQISGPAFFIAVLFYMNYQKKKK
jgi:hypothetical protein